MRNNKENLLTIAMILFAISSTLSFIAQSKSDLAIENALYFRNGNDALQEDNNSIRVLRSLCDGMDNNSTACYEYNQKLKSISNYNSDLSEKLKEYNENYQKSNKQSKTFNILSFLSLLSGLILAIISFNQKD